MTGLEICLIVIGVLCIACSFIFSEHLLSKEIKDDIVNGVNVSSVTKEIVKKEVEAELASVIDEKIEEIQAKLGTMTNEKIMALADYYEDIQGRITKNHDEVMFLYNMLNDKEDSLKDTIKDIEAMKSSVKKMAIVNDIATDITKTGNVIKQKKTESSESVKMPGKKSSDAVPEQENNLAGEEKNNNNKMILKLYQKGYSNIQIAKELGLGVGEVRLVIDLFKK